MTAADQPTTEPSVRGWVVVDKKTGALDWDAELHPSYEAAYLGLRAYGDTVEATEERRTFYDVLPVLDAGLIPLRQPSADDIWAEVRAARARAHAKHGDQSIEALPPTDPRWLSILVEEVGETAHELTYDATGSLRAELLDVLSVASAWVDAIDRAAAEVTA